MANLTISIPDDLKSQMDSQFPETNWSSVCRSAIQQYVATRQNPYPRLEMFLEGIVQSPTSETGQPTFNTNIRIENRSPLDIVVDRIKLVMVLTSGTTTIVGREIWHLAPLYVYVHQSSFANDIFYLSPDDILRTESSVKQSPVVKIRADAYAVGFQMVVQAQLQSKIALDDWQTFLANVKAIYSRREVPGKS